jgi:glutamyl-tRNA reductase
MFSDLILIHRQSPQAFNADSGWALWQTCLRKIAIGGADSLGSIQIEAGDQILSGSEAYQFCLEVVCGLHSPLVGETEVFGQFKTASETWNFSDSPLTIVLRPFIRGIIEDAKRIRSKYLADLGSQSYGSLLRRELRGIQNLSIIGAGQLTSEILPWLCKEQCAVNVLVRNLASAKDLKHKFQAAKFESLQENSGNLAGALILSAPVSAAWLNGWLEKNSNLEVIVDLRGESATDPITSNSIRIISLAEVMSRINQNQEVIAHRRDEALKAVVEAAHTRLRAVENRPFGWDDVCA